MYSLKIRIILRIRIYSNLKNPPKFITGGIDNRGQAEVEPKMSSSLQLFMLKLS